MTRYLHASGIRIFDYSRFAVTLRERLRQGNCVKEVRDKGLEC